MPNGSICFFENGFFVLVFFLARRAARTSGADKMYCHIASIMAICCVLIAIYNSSLRTEAGYMAYFVLALPFVGGTKRQAVAPASAGRASTPNGAARALDDADDELLYAPLSGEASQMRNDVAAELDSLDEPFGEMNKPPASHEASDDG